MLPLNPTSLFETCEGYLVRNFPPAHDNYMHAHDSRVEAVH